jgi:hypothetical protein
MEFKHPKYYAELRKQGRKLSSSQAPGGKHPNQRTRVQASSQSQQAEESSSQSTSEQAHGPGCKQRE